MIQNIMELARSRQLKQLDDASVRLHDLRRSLSRTETGKQHVRISDEILRAVNCMNGLIRQLKLSDAEACRYWYRPNQLTA